MRVQEYDTVTAAVKRNPELKDVRDWFVDRASDRDYYAYSGTSGALHTIPDILRMFGSKKKGHPAAVRTLRMFGADDGAICRKIMSVCDSNVADRNAGDDGRDDAYVVIYQWLGALEYHIRRYIESIGEEGVDRKTEEANLCAIVRDLRSDPTHLLSR